MIEKVGFIGLGNMGKPMAKRLVNAGYDVTVYDIRKEAQDELVKMGATGVSSAQEVAKACSTIITMVWDDSETEEVIAGKNGIIGEPLNGMLIILMGTISIGLCRKMASIVSRKGGSVVDAPVSGAAKRAEEGTLSIMVDGDKHDFERCLPVLKTMGKHVFYLGAIGSAQVAKLANNLATYMAEFGILEALTLAKAAGIDAERVLEVMRASTANSFSVENWDSIINRRRASAPETHRLTLRKDLSLIVQVADDFHVDLPLIKDCQGIDFTANLERLLH